MQLSPILCRIVFPTFIHVQQPEIPYRLANGESSHSVSPAATWWDRSSAAAERQWLCHSNSKWLLLGRRKEKKCGDFWPLTSTGAVAGAQRLRSGSEAAARAKHGPSSQYVCFHQTASRCVSVAKVRRLVDYQLEMATKSRLRKSLVYRQFIKKKV